MSKPSDERFKKEPHIKAKWTEAHIHELQKQFFESLDHLESKDHINQKPRFIITQESAGSELSNTNLEHLSEERAKEYFQKISKKFEKYKKFSPSSACRVSDIHQELQREDFTLKAFISFLTEKEKRQEEGSDCYIEIKQLVEILDKVSDEFNAHLMSAPQQQALAASIESLFMNQRTIDAKTFKCFEKLNSIADPALVKRVVQFWAELHAEALCQEVSLLQQWILVRLKLVNDP